MSGRQYNNNHHRQSNIVITRIINNNHQQQQQQQYHISLRSEFSLLLNKIGVTDKSVICSLWKDVENALNGSYKKNENDNFMNDKQKLVISEKSNETYRLQMKKLNDELDSLRSKIENKQNIIENLLLRYDLGVIKQDSTKSKNLSKEEIDNDDGKELRNKAEAITCKTVLENFELREFVNELREENFIIRDEVYEMKQVTDKKKAEIVKLINILNAYGLDENTPVDRRELHGNKGNEMLSYGYVRDEIEYRYDIEIVKDMKHLIAVFIGTYIKYEDNEDSMVDETDDDTEDDEDGSEISDLSHESMIELLSDNDLETID